MKLKAKNNTHLNNNDNREFYAIDLWFYYHAVGHGLCQLITCRHNFICMNFHKTTHNNNCDIINSGQIEFILNSRISLILWYWTTSSLDNGHYLFNTIDFIYLFMYGECLTQLYTNCV